MIPAGWPRQIATVHETVALGQTVVLYEDSLVHVDTVAPDDGQPVRPWFAQRRVQTDARRVVVVRTVPGYAMTVCA